MKYLFFHPSTIVILFHSLIVIVFSIRVIMKRPATGVALAWLLLIASTPFVGVTIYLLIGERRISHERAKDLKSLRIDYAQLRSAAFAEGLITIDWPESSNVEQAMDRIGLHLIGLPTVHGSTYRLSADTQETLEAIARDVDTAQDSVLMEFYIWHAGGHADTVLEAVIRAAQRGVHCCLLIDALGARPWWKTDQPRRLREAGVQLLPALPVGLFRTLVGRTDLRLHRKIVVIDSKIAWTGSMNLVDPRFFKQDSGVGQWVDAMLRLEGAVVVPLAATMIGDWIIESKQTLDDIVDRAKLRAVEPAGSANLQVIPSGPGESSDVQLQMILALINSAQQEVVLTTPYLVPDESLLRAIRGAAARDIAVKLIVPEKVDSLLTRHASRSYFDDLLDSGIEVYLYRQGLLHTKSITVDRSRAMFGTVNLDMRSLWLNYEVALYVYDRDLSAAIHDLQTSYLTKSERLDPAEWARRPFTHRFLENTFRLTSPLL